MLTPQGFLDDLGGSPRPLRAARLHTYRGERMPWPEFLASANRVKAQNRQQPPGTRKDVVVFDVLDQTASAKLTAYWGVDYLLLAKEDGRWKVTHVQWQTPPK